MENKHIIIILLIVIVILAAAIGFTLFSQSNKEVSIVKITSANKLEEGKDLSIKLTDLKENPIQKEIVSIKITDKKGKVVVDDVVKTDAKGKAKYTLDLDKGKYDVVIVYEGNNSYAGDNDTQKLTIKEKEAAQAESSSSSSSSPTPYAYKSDGTPMYSQAEVDNYMLNKYGMVDYHLNDNGYVNLDEPGFDDKGNYVGY